jgi:hypothetical protein
MIHRFVRLKIMTVIYHTISLTVMTLDQREGENFAYFA